MASNVNMKGKAKANGRDWYHIADRSKLKTTASAISVTHKIASSFVAAENLCFFQRRTTNGGMKAKRPPPIHAVWLWRDVTSKEDRAPKCSGPNATSTHIVN